MTKSIVILLICCLLIPIMAEDPLIESSFEGGAGLQVPVYKKSVGNQWGYLEYLPESFSESSRGLGIVFYFNGANTGSGTGDDSPAGLPEMLTQGLPKEIKDGLHPDQIVISTQVGGFGYFNDPDQIYVVDEYIEFITDKYSKYIDRNRIYFSGFSQGAGSVVKYAQAYPEKVAAVFPVAQGFYVNYKNAQDQYPNHTAGAKLADTPTWLFHHKDDGQIQGRLSSQYHEFLAELNPTEELHKLTIYEQSSSASKNHDVTNWAYQTPELWSWLANQSLDGATPIESFTLSSPRRVGMSQIMDRIQFNQTVSGSFMVYDMRGRQLSYQTVNQTSSITLSSLLASGAYVGMFIDDSGISESVSLIF